MKMRTLTVVVDRSRWLRGEGEALSRLLRIHDSKMCCLGFACLAAGHLEKDIIDIATPYGIKTRTPVLLPNYNLHWAGEAMSVNDDVQITESHREASITELLASIGIAMSFVDGPHFPSPTECVYNGLGPHVRAPLDAQCIHCQTRLEEREGAWQAVKP